MIDAIVYTSKCGHTLAYAKLLSEKINVPYYTLKEAKRKLKKGNHIIYMSWVRENKIMKYDHALRYHIECVIAVGIMPRTEERLGFVKEQNQVYASLYYLPGGISKTRLGWINRIRLKSIESDLSFKLLDHGLIREDALALDAILHNSDFFDATALDPIIMKYKVKEDYVS